MSQPVCINGLSVAAAESVPAHEADDLYSTLRHVRIPREKASEFWKRVEELRAPRTARLSAALDRPDRDRLLELLDACSAALETERPARSG